MCCLFLVIGTLQQGAADVRQEGVELEVMILPDQLGATA